MTSITWCLTMIQKYLFHICRALASLTMISSRVFWLFWKMATSILARNLHDGKKCFDKRSGYIEFISRSN